MLRVCFCWTDISGYMASCWRVLADRPGLDVHVMAYDSSKATSFDHELMSDISWTPISAAERHDAKALANRLSKINADIVVLPGWLNPAYRKLPKLLASQAFRYLMTMDTPWSARPRQHLTGLLLKRYLKSFAGVVVTGERSWQYAVRLGFDPDRIYRGLYGVDCRSLDNVLAHRQLLPSWPRQFLFIGRYANDKGVDVLVDGYRRYRDLVSDPWPLVCCGQGTQQPLLADSPGVTDLGFCQPAEVYRRMAQSAVLVLPSRFDPWPLSLVEGCAAGLPIVCSDACGSAVEMVRDGYNGLIIPSNRPDQLAGALQRMHVSHDRLPAYGIRSHELAKPYSHIEWADRWTRIIERTMETAPLRLKAANEIHADKGRKAEAA